jgi:hypothetical protein
MSPDKLRYQANQIATFFASQPESEQIEGVADHINKFWDPRMRAQLFEITDRAPMASSRWWWRRWRRSGVRSWRRARNRQPPAVSMQVHLTSPEAWPRVQRGPKQPDAFPGGDALHAVRQIFACQFPDLVDARNSVGAPHPG